MIFQSKSEDWHVIPCGEGDGPSYRYYLHIDDPHARPATIAGVEFHTTGAVFQEDISLTLAYGLTLVPDSREPWLLDKFSFVNTRAVCGSIHIADLFYHSALVYRQKYVWIRLTDMFVPFPEDSAIRQVSRASYEMVRLLNNLSGVSKKDYDHTLKKAGFQVEYGS